MYGRMRVVVASRNEPSPRLVTNATARSPERKDQPFQRRGLSAGLRLPGDGHVPKRNIHRRA